MVGWHRREDRPVWADIFRLQDLDDEQLVDDGTAIGELGVPEWQHDVKRSHVHRYRFPPQDTKLTAGDRAIDVDDQDDVGLVVAIDAADGWIDLQIGKPSEPRKPRGLGRNKYVENAVLRRSIADTAEHVLRGEDCLGGRLIRRVTPTGFPVRDDESPVDAMLRLGTSLAGEVLAVQGPPGTGKSSTGAELICALLDRDSAWASLRSRTRSSVAY